jgi:hypothetical protein
MMASFMRCLRSAPASLIRIWVVAACVLLLSPVLRAQGVGELASFALDRGAEDLTLSATVQFDLPGQVEEALSKGIPMVFVAETSLLRERWYWSDKVVAETTRQYRLAFQPLTRRWRVSLSSGAAATTGQGLALSQSFDTLDQALASIKRISRWRVAALADMDPTLRYRFEFNFRLDLGQLPRPFQIGAIGQGEWVIAVSRVETLPAETRP